MTNAQSKVELIGGVEKRRIVIEDYNSEWPERFAFHRKIIGGALAEIALQIEHIGSTSVLGLAAKPIIDILVAVSDASDEELYLPKLNAVGYVLRVRDRHWHEHRMLRTPEKDVHIHIYSAGCAEIERNLLFRDRLRDSVDDCQRYEKLKRLLAGNEWPDMNAYADAKSGMIEDIIAAARASKNSWPSS